VSLEPSDNDSAALVASVLAAVDSILDLEHSIWESLNVPQPALEDVVVPSLVDACVACGQPFVLVLDDLHLVSESRCWHSATQRHEHCSRPSTCRRDRRTPRSPPPSHPG